MNLDGLLEDGSWQFDGPASAAFRLAPDTTARRGALVEHILGRPEPDPELWESILIETFLNHPAASDLQRLRLEMTDFHHSARRAASAIARQPRTALTELWFGHPFRYLYETATTSTGRGFNPLDHYDEGFVGDAGGAMWQALPALRTLTVEGALLFHAVSAPAVIHVRSRGVISSDGSVLPGPLPTLTHFELEIATDVFGTACPVEQLEELTPASFPALISLDLTRAEFDGEPLLTLANLPILSHLTSLRVGPHELDDTEWAAIAPHFDHLSLTISGT
ncbi:hypothetical protein Aph02nite_65740 [Actinoplanes philippinensis]|uniref:Leucine-rich repeat domain-containing protein n=1 Tax=Actinoplanes philippinensis TaxID=35752 RepID=A0A1I2LCU1_9ACTN|nr:hypothetical protein [Actinoplanes philippinensis]GIE80624.1 hypothetical protein Aph02nite_65740 [Actinoplanes philippinensis]SFF76348.1 hypothetical protein SAMN05421541_1212 [Actinoplanes philippinensis]